MKLPSIQGIPLEYIRSVVKIDSNSLSGLTWLPREDGQWNGRYANENAGSKSINAKDGYQLWKTIITYNGKNHCLKCSRIIFLLHNGYLTEGKQIDHDDGDSLNNKASNLRESTGSQNSQNRKKPKNNTSGHKGVSWNEASGKWMVLIYLIVKSYYFGLHEKLEDAIKVATEARNKLHGEFGRIK